MNIGFIGLGIMGYPMAKNLISAGYTLHIFDLVSERVEQLATLGAVAEINAEAVAKQSDVIITMLPNSSHVQEVMLGDHGVLQGTHPGSIVIDMSSIAPEVSKQVYQACEAKQVEMLEAPVSGGEPKAIDGTLSIMVGGKQDVFEQVKDSILLKMGASAVYCGGPGAGNTTKLANQIIVACNIAACAEAFHLAKQADVDCNLVFQAIRGGLAGSTVMDAKVPMMLNHQFDPGFRIELHIKDLNNAIETAHTVGSPVPLSAQVMEMFQVLKQKGQAAKDHSALMDYELLGD